MVPNLANKKLTLFTLYICKTVKRNDILKKHISS